MQPVWGHGLNTVSKTISTQFQVKDLKICANLGKETESLFSPVCRGEFKDLLFEGDFQSKLYFIVSVGILLFILLALLKGDVG